MSFSSTRRHSMPLRGQPQLPSGGAFMSVIKGVETSVMLKPVR